MPDLEPRREALIEIQAEIDCVLIGYNDPTFQQVFDNAGQTQKNTPRFREFRRNSLSFRGRRLQYMDVFNKAVEEVSGVDPQYNLWHLPNLGISYLQSFLMKQDLKVEKINFFNADQEALDRFLAQQPAVVAITTTFYVSNDPIIEIIEYVRARSPSSRIIVGGPHIYNICTDYESPVLEYTLEMIGADIYIFDSQGEATLAQVVRTLRGNPTASLDVIPNLYYCTGQGSFEHSHRLPENNDMDANSVDWSRFDPSFFTPTVQIRTARSCAFKCAFCRYPAVGGPLNLTSLDTLEKELICLHEKGVKNVIFIDDTFNIPLPRFKKICQMLISNQFNFNWFSYFRCANTDKKAIDLMAESGCKAVFLGIESGDQTILDNMNKSAKIDRYKLGMQQLKQRDIITYAAFFVGFPGETRQTFQNTLDFIEETAPTYYNVGLYYHDPKTPIHQRVDEFGLKGQGFQWRHDTMDWREANDLVDEMFLSVTQSLILPSYNFDFWSLPYLAGLGYSFEQIQLFMEKVQPMLIRSIKGEQPDETKEMELILAFAEKVYEPQALALPG